MRNFLRIQKAAISINLFSLLLGIAFYLLLNQKVEVPIAFVASGISFSISFLQYKIQDDQIFKELFMSFNSKYDNKFNDILNKIVEKTNLDSHYELVGTEIPLIIDYFNFCSEEYLWYTKNRIPSEVWIAWEDGMIFFLNTSSINLYFIKEYHY